MSLNSIRGCDGDRRQVFQFIVFLGLACGGNGCGDRSTQILPQADSPLAKVTTQFSKPVPPPSDYVGSQVCAECHREISEQFAAHPMGLSAGPLPDVPIIEKYGESAAFVGKDGRRYFAEHAVDKVVHHESFATDNAEPAYDQGVEMELSIGSGRHGRSYAYRRGDRFYMSPLSWYTTAEKWDLSPGYQPVRHHRFDRLLTERCLVCHVGQMTRGPGIDSWDHKQPITEYAISCERCHGPAASHVEHFRQLKTKVTADHIVNPAKLEPLRRDAVCHQCHFKAAKTLPRYGRRAVDFRPGDRLTDVWVVISDKIVERQAVTHSEQMLASACYRGSQGRFGCISCHNPHKLPTGEPGVWFDQKCASCHTESKDPCELPSVDRSDKSCISCHMPRIEMNNVPHTALTDHRILKRPQSQRRNEGSKFETLDFDEGEPKVPDWEIRRAKALQVRIDRRAFQNPEEMQQALTTLLELSEQIAEDADLWETAAWITSRQGKWKLVEVYARKALDLESNRIESRELLVGSLSDRNAWPDVARECERLIEQDPGRAMYHKLLAEARWHQADLEGGLTAAERSLECDPMQWDLRRRLAQAYQQLGDSDRSRFHQKVLNAVPRTAQ